MNRMINGLFGDLYLTSMGMQPPRHHDDREFADMTSAPHVTAQTPSGRRGVMDALQDMLAWLSLNWRSAS